MKPAFLFRTTSLLLVLFGGTHTYGLLHQKTGGMMADVVRTSMRTVHFDIMGFSRSYWEMYEGFGLLVTVFLFFSAVLSWQLGDLAKGHGRLAQALAWPFALCYVAVAALCWTNFFLAPGIVSSAIAVSLAIAAWATGKK